MISTTKRIVTSPPPMYIAFSLSCESLIMREWEILQAPFLPPETEPLALPVEEILDGSVER